MKVTIYSIILAVYAAGLHVHVRVPFFKKRPTTQTIKLLPTGLSLYALYVSHILRQNCLLTDVIMSRKMLLLLYFVWYMYLF